jgi:ribosomal protein S18 acetylase RimI-like enzyme
LPRGLFTRASVNADAQMLRELCLAVAAEDASAQEPHQQTLTLWTARQRDAELSQRFPDMVRLTICTGDGAVGRLLVDSHDHRIRVVDIAVLPQFRGQGIGTALVQELLDEAGLTGVSVLADVPKGSRAVDFFEGLGFSKTYDLGDSWTLTSG